MFLRRNSPRHQPLNTPSPSAQSAAFHAFLAHQGPSNNLSAAAAAAALRSHTPTPTQVENVQTKRMLRRQSSAASSRDGFPSNVRRSSSLGSMTSRTFRDQSPRRPMSSSGALDGPPVPPLPPHLNLPDHPSSHRRSASLESPVGRSSTGHAFGFSNSPGLSGMAEIERPESVNFSYPMNLQPESPCQSPSPPDSPRAKDGEQSPVRGLSPMEAADIRYSVSKIASQPVKTKSKRVAPGASEGSHLSRGGMCGLPTGTAAETGQDWQSDRPGIHRVNEVDDTESEFDAVGTAKDIRGQQVGHHHETIDTTSMSNLGEHSQQHALRPGPKKRPSTVLEDRQGEQRAEETDIIAGNANRSFAVNKNLTVQVSAPTEGSHNSSSRSAFQRSHGGDEAVLKAENRSGLPVEPPPISADYQLSIRYGTARREPGRPHSMSPNRSTRFSTQLAVTSNGEPLHVPPPRSMSPAKPALKHSSLQSLSPDRQRGIVMRTGQTPSEMSDATSVASDDGSRSGSRKKAAKVSFDEAEIVGIASSPPTSPESIGPPSPPEKYRAIVNYAGFTKKSPAKDISDDEFDQVLKPRPALPSFGSIRGCKEADEMAHSSEVVSDNESISSSNGCLVPVDESFSSDLAIGGILAGAKPPQRPKRMLILDEPLPPEVTSAEGYVSTSESEGSMAVVEKEIRPARLMTHEEQAAILSEHLALNKWTDGRRNDIAEKNLTPDIRVDPIPVIALLPPTPNPDKSRHSLELQRMPGEFPSSASQQQLWTTESDKPAQLTAIPQPANIPSVTATPESPYSSAEVSEDDSDDDESGESIYSDAAEDLASVEGDGFGSINAIVDSPVAVTTDLAIKASDESSIRPNPRKITANGSAQPRSFSTDERPSASAQYSTPFNLDEQETGGENAAVTPSKQSAIEPPSVENTSAPVWPPKPKSEMKSALASGTSPPEKNLVKAARSISADDYGGGHLSQALHGTDGRKLDLGQRRSFTAMQPSGPQINGRSQQKRQHMSSPAIPENKEKASGSKQQSRSRSMAAQQSTVFTGILGRTLSNGSDSSSSFKRSKRSPKSKGQHTMKRTLRESTRPQSPVGTPPSPGATKLRTTLRRSGLSGTQNEKASNFTNVGKASRSRKSKAYPPSKSRFPASDDESDGGLPRDFRSRFQDVSDDDDDPSATPLRPVRGIPRRQSECDGDSTELQDSSDEEASSAVKPDDPTIVLPLSGTRMSRDELLDIISHPKKSGLLGRLKFSKKNPTKDGKIRKVELESAARRDTPLERSRLELDHMREERLLNGHGGSTVTTITENNSRPSSPKLQKKSVGGMLQGNGSWPLQSQAPPKEADAAHDEKLSERPRTSDGISEDGPAEGGSASPGPEKARDHESSSRFGFKRRSRQNTNNSVTSDISVDETRRKKRFPLLRKAFGLRD
ncbi:hypothetical protein V8E54_010228 [Elaphomyces granulatus]